MYGSDWWMNTLHQKWRHLRAVAETRTLFGDLFGTEVASAVLGGNALRFLGFSGDPASNEPTLNARRLKNFYGEHPAPKWLNA
jgi:hypothetical protein